MANFEEGGSGPLAMASVKGTVKWFNSTKGYGFITLESGSDAFCHASALQALGQPNVPQGSTVVCDLQDSPRGLQVVAVHSIDTSTADPTPARRPRPGGDRSAAAMATALAAAAVTGLAAVTASAVATASGAATVSAVATGLAAATVSAAVIASAEAAAIRAAIPDRAARWSTAR